MLHRSCWTIKGSRQSRKQSVRIQSSLCEVGCEQNSRDCKGLTNSCVVKITNKQSIHGTSLNSGKKDIADNKEKLNTYLFLICLQLVNSYLVVRWLIRRKIRVRAPVQTSKQNTKRISSAIFSQQISDKNSVK